jgi:DNA invertase Pin-like site-specific DNA recombinase
MERELIRERVKAGVDAAVEKGRRGGRPKALTSDKEAILKALVQAENMSVTQICKTVGISRSVYYRAIETLK